MFISTVVPALCTKLSWTVITHRSMLQCYPLYASIEEGAWSYLQIGPEFYCLYVYIYTWGPSQRSRGLRRGSWSHGYRDPGFESCPLYGFLSSFFWFVLSCVGRGIAMGWLVVQGVLRAVQETVSKPCTRKLPRFFENWKDKGLGGYSIYM